MDNFSELINPAIRSHIRTEFQRGITSTDCLGVHGTSLEKLQYMCRNGVLPGKQNSGEARFSKGDIFFDRVKNGIISINDMDDVAYYAKLNGGQHYIMKTLGMNFSDERDYSVALGFLGQSKYIDQNKKFVELIKKRNWDLELVKNVVSEAEQQKGVILGINISASNNYKTLNKDNHDLEMDGSRLVTNGKGLPFGFILGIKPLGERETQFIQSL